MKQDATNSKPPIVRLIASSEVRERTLMSRATLARRVAAGHFPRPILIGYNRHAWREADVVEWIESR